MKILVAGATGVIGRALLPRLLRQGHEVIALTREPKRVEQLRAGGADVILCDVFDSKRLVQALVRAEPEIVIHQLTSLPSRIDPRHVGQSLAQTNRLRSEGTRILMDAALLAGVRRFVAQSISTYYAPGGDAPAVESEPLYLQAPPAFADIVRAIDNLERTVLQTPKIEGIALRYGYLYGPGTAYATDGTMAEDVRHRRIPIIGNGGGVFSYVHVEDAASAAVMAVNQGEPGIYNIVDDEATPLREWLPIYAELIGAPQPMRIPKVIGQLAAGRFGVYWATEQRGASNRKAKELLGWRPAYASWREGFAAELAPTGQVGLVGRTSIAGFEP